MAVNKVFPTRKVSGLNCNGATCVSSSINAFSGYCIKDNRSKRPIPLQDTGMTIYRSFQNAAFDYRAKTVPLKGTIGWVCVNGSQTTKLVERDTRGDAPALRNRALANFASGDIDLGMFIVEFRSTARTVGSALAAVPALVKDFRKKVPDLSLNVLSKRGADNYLALNFGLKPLVDDVFGALSEFRNTVQVGQVISGRTGRSSPKIMSVPHAVGPDGSPPDFGELASFAVARGTVKNAGIRTLQQLGLINIPALAWNALPLSFVIDWFLPVGDVLRGLTADLGMSGVHATSVTERRRDQYLGNPGRGVPLTWSNTEQAVYRQVSSHPAAASSLIRGLNLSLEPDLRKLVTSTALYRQRMRGY